MADQQQPNVETRAMARARRDAERNHYHPHAACGGFGAVPRMTRDERMQLLRELQQRHGAAEKVVDAAVSDADAV